MTFYTASYVWLLFSLFLIIFSEGRSSISWQRIVLFIGFAPSVLLAVLRGDVGTDTGNYLQMATSLLDESNSVRDDFDVEIGFFLLLKYLVFLIKEPRFVVNLISLSIACYLFFLYSKNIESMIVFSLLIFPVFFFDMSMNGLRYGLAFLFAKHASDKLNSNKWLGALALIFFSLIFQLSGILIFILLQVKKLHLRSLFVLILLLIFLFFIFEDRLLYKYYSYKVLESPGGLSGLVPLSVFLICYLGFYFVDREEARKSAFLFISQILAFFLARVSYAGLRFQLLILFVFFCCISGVKFEKWKNKKLAVGLFLIIGLMGFLGKLRNFSDDVGIPPSPFLPYHFFWEIE